MPTWLAIALAVLTFAVGVYGAVLSTVVFRRQQAMDRPRLRLEFGHSYRNGPAGGEPLLCSTIQARNFGYRPIEVEGVGFVVGEEDIELPPFEVEPGPLPKRLEDGETVRFHFRKGGYVPALKQTVADRIYVRAGGERYEEEPPPGVKPVQFERPWP